MSSVRLHFLWRRLAIPLLLASGLQAQTGPYEGKQINTIQFVPVRQPLEPAELNEILPMKMKTAFRMAEVRSSIERLFATGRYADIQVDADLLPNNEVRVRFFTKNSWFVGRVSVDSDIADNPNPGQLVNATGLQLGRPFREEDVEQAEVRIKQLLENNGLYEARVQTEREYDDTAQQIHLRFDIATGARARFMRPEVTGDLKLPPQEIVDAARWKRWLIGTWRPVTQTRVLNGLERIRNRYEDENRLLAKVQLESLKYDSDTQRAQPVVRVDAGPKVELRAIGADISESKLRRYVPIYEEDTVDQDLLVEGRRNLRDYLQSEGYFEAEVEFKQQRVVNDRAVIDFIINLGERHRLVSVQIAGNRYFDTETIRERMFMTPSSLIQFRYGRYSESLRRRDEEAIANLYRSNGFRDVAVTSTVVDDYENQQGDVAVFVKIEEGEQWFVESLEIEGVQQLPKEEALARVTSTEGQPFSEFSVAVDRDAILNYYFSMGFTDVFFTWTSRPAAAPNRVHLIYSINEGQRQFVREVLVSGLETTQENLVYRNLLLNPGDPLSPISLTETQRRLYDLGVFAKVEMAVQNPEGETSRKYVLYQMEEARKYSITGGLGAEIARIGGAGADLDSPNNQPGFSPRVSLDFTRYNFRGLGHSLSFRSRVSSIQKRALASYSAPRISNVEGRSLVFTTLYEDSRDVRTFSAIRREVSVQLAERLSKPTTALFRYAFRNVSTSDLRINPLLVPLLSQPVRIGIVSGNLIQDRRDDPVEPTRGVFNTLDVGVATQYLGSQRDFLRALARNSTYHQIGRRYVLARALSVGALRPFRFDAFSSDSTQAVPFAERFFGGGGTSHRGFPENQAGPRDLTTGFPLGGNALLFHNTELRFPLLGDNIGGVVFHDAGNVYSSLGDISFSLRQRDQTDFNYLVQAAGLGVRYRTPIGPVRVDLSYAFNPPRFFGFEGSFADLTACGGPNSPVTCQGVPRRLNRFNFFVSIGQTF
jgi:outer membrane protein insertion porin family